MNKLYKISALLVAAVTITSTAFAASPSVSVNENGDLKTVKGSVTIDAPASQVWATVTNYNSMKNYLPGYKKSQVIANNGANKKVDLSVKVSKLLPAFNYQVAVSENASAKQITVQRVSGDFDSIHATYKLIPNGTQTTLVYTLKIDPGDKVPGFGVNTALKDSTSDSLAAISNRCSSEYKRSQVALN